MKTIGLDVGGANLKLADGRGYSRHLPFALWQTPQQLTGVLQRLIREAPPAEQIALTMTGELTDCFATKQEGVAFIVDATCAATCLPVVVYLLDGRFANPAVAKQQYLLAAAANWHGLTRYLATRPEFVNERGLLIDIGSTTSDIIPFGGGQCLALGQTDFQRLVQRELVYTGVVRSPVCGILPRLEHRGQWCPVMNELFATALDAHVVLGHLVPGTCVEYAADHGGTLVADCVRRLARLVGLDSSLMSLDEARHLARQIADAQIRMLAAAATEVVDRTGVPKIIVTSGQGEFLAGQIANRIRDRHASDAAGCPLIYSFGQWFDAAVSSCATAHALAAMAAGNSPGRQPVSR